jgi:hypothetical protein
MCGTLRTCTDTQLSTAQHSTQVAACAMNVYYHNSRNGGTALQRSIPVHFNTRVVTTRACCTYAAAASTTAAAAAVAAVALLCASKRAHYTMQSCTAHYLSAHYLICCRKSRYCCCYCNYCGYRAHYLHCCRNSAVPRGIGTGRAVASSHCNRPAACQYKHISSGCSSSSVACS